MTCQITFQEHELTDLRLVMRKKRVQFIKGNNQGQSVNYDETV